MKKLVICLAIITFSQGLLPAQNGGQPNPTAYTLGFSTYLAHGQICGPLQRLFRR